MAAGTRAARKGGEGGSGEGIGGEGIGIGVKGGDGTGGGEGVAGDLGALEGLARSTFFFRPRNQTA